MTCDNLNGRSPAAGSTIGCGYEFVRPLFTFNERLVPFVFRGLYLDDEYMLGQGERVVGGRVGKLSTPRRFLEDQIGRAHV